MELGVIKKVYAKTLASEIVPVSLKDIKPKNTLFKFVIGQEKPKKFIDLTEEDLLLFKTHNMEYVSNFEEFKEHYVKYEQENIVYYRIKRGKLFGNGWINENGNLKCAIIVF